jgi:hypothetical protein
MSEPFLVQGPIAGVVEAWSERRLPFEPTGDSLRFRTALRVALTGLVAAGQSGLRAEFASTSSDFVDAENVLFYNVGASAFTRADRAVVAFERSEDVPAPPTGFGPYFHRYEVVAAPFWRRWVEADVLAGFGPTAVSAIASLTPMADVWHAVRTGPVDVRRLAATDDRLGLILDIAAPREVHLAAVMKPLIDGVVAAFHAHDGSDGGELSRRVAGSLSLDTGQIRSLLEEPERAVLGQRRLLWRRGAGVQWNPGDDVLLAVQLRTTVSAAKGWFLDGRIVQLDRATSMVSSR